MCSKLLTVASIVRRRLHLHTFSFCGRHGPPCPHYHLSAIYINKSQYFLPSRNHLRTAWLPPPQPLPTRHEQACQHTSPRQLPPQGLHGGHELPI
ncbi:hypothetical protein E2C01_061885 [Portunus trituberculatus]|uniref:Uncharacterized protein n=1 Tax=Portunus trituberculatus TaxID=210409 RepID=A0A5B7HDM4_PORTR|nr:hypothetical protein [Portunus trituberculatus]